jgi:NADH:ubiquinone oxidoreductase subunit H
LRLVVLETKDLESLLKTFDSSPSLNTSRWQKNATDLNPVNGNLFLLIVILTPIISILLRYVIALMAIAFYTLIERKFLGYFQIRKGPNKPSLLGLPQPFADAIKLFVKEQAKPTISNTILFIAAPTISLILAIMI